MVHSPFPGMDLYLEDDKGWRSVQFRFMASIIDQLTEQVSPHYFVEVRERTFFDPFEEMDFKERYIEVIDRSSRGVITRIELLSPTNKTKNTEMRTSLIEARQKSMKSKINWVEIDLWRAGERFREVADKSDYYTLLKRRGVLGRYEVWYIDLMDRLPVIAIPLRESEPDAPLDLQAAFEDAYQRGHYFEKIDYTASPPLPPLNEKKLRWVQEQIRQWQSVTA